MTEQALVSIVVPVYNRHNYLAECLDSLMVQTYRNLEIILVDDGSTDDSLAICQSYAKKDARIKVIAQENAGVATARNTGVQAATGQYLMFVDSDDYVAKNYCELAVNALQKNQVDICCMGFVDVDSKGQQVKQLRDFSAGPITKEQAMVISIDDSYLWNKAFKTELVKAHPFPENKLYEDVYVVYKIFEDATSFCYVPQAPYYYVVRNDSIVADMGARNIADQFDSSNEQYKFFQAKYPAVATGMAEFMLVRALRYCTYCPKNYNRSLYEQAYQIIKTSPVDPVTLDRRYQVTMKLFRFSAPLALAIFKLRKLTNR